MDEAYLDDGPAVNFETATLEISKDNDGLELNTSGLIIDGHELLGKDAKRNSDARKQASSVKNLSSVPFERLDVRSFFSHRNEIVEKAMHDCQTIVASNDDKDIVGSWLLTEISLWDTEKERLVLLTKEALYSIKYDFISLNVLRYNKVSLADIDTVVTGELVYPPSSLVPRLNGLAEGLSSIIHCAVRQDWSSFATCSSLTQLEPRYFVPLRIIGNNSGSMLILCVASTLVPSRVRYSQKRRHTCGIRLLWNKGQSLPFNKKWNPFAKNIPWLTYASHPLFWCKGSEAEKTRFDVEGLHSALLSFLPEECNVVSGSIIIENYCGVGALVHNKNDLGFFKIRGKVSF